MMKCSKSTEEVVNCPADSIFHEHEHEVATLHVLLAAQFARSQAEDELI